LLEQYYLLQLRRLHPADRWAFQLSVTDNLSKPFPRYDSV
jgi:hypothetical protein